ncbi:MAG: hypothetical protein ACKVOK_04580 [Flavobacteriales bacterium]
MKLLYSIPGILLFNGLLLILAIRIYFYTSPALFLRNENPMGLDTLIITVVLVLGFILFMAKEKLRKFIPGITFVLAPLAVFAFFKLNESLYDIGNYERFPVKYRQWNGSSGFLYYGFPGYSFEHAVRSDYYIDIDSIDVRIDRGLFGLKVITDSVRVVEMPRRNYAPSYINDINQIHLETAENLTFERRFNDALDQYDAHLRVDSNSHEAYYGRGVIYQLKGKYDLALKDFLTSTSIKYTQFQGYSAKETDLRFAVEVIVSLVDSIESHSPHATEQIIEQLRNLDKFDEFKTRIEYCMAMLKE